MILGYFFSANVAVIEDGISRVFFAVTFIVLLIVAAFVLRIVGQRILESAR